MTVQTAVLIETLVELGAEVRWVSCNIFSTQDHAAAAVVVGPHGTAGGAQGRRRCSPGRARRCEEYWWCTEQMLDLAGRRRPEHDPGRRRRRHAAGPQGRAVREGRASCRSAEADDSEEWAVILGTLRASLAADNGKWTKIAEGIRGVTEETTTGVMRLYQLAAAGELLFPAINVNDSVTKSKFDNRYGIRHSLIDGINRATDVLIGGKVAVVCGYGDVGKGAAESLRGQGARVVVTEIDPICALQAAMDGYEVRRSRTSIEPRRHRHHHHRQQGHRHASSTWRRMKHQAIVGNIGHFDNEIDMAGLARFPGIRRIEIKPQVDEWVFPDGHSIIVLSEGRLLNLGNATGHPSFVMSNSFSNQVIAQIELFTKHQEYDKRGVPPAEVLDEKVARIHLEALGGKLTKLTKDQAEYIGVDVEGPYKPEHYRY